MKVSIEIQPIVSNKTGVGWYTQKLLEKLTCEDIDIQGNVFNFFNRNDISGSIEKIDFKIVTNKIMPYSLYKRMCKYIPVPYNFMFNDNSSIYHFFNYIVPPKIDGKVITTVYDMVYKLYPETMTKQNYEILDRELKRSVERADKIITISQNSKKEIIKYLNVEESKIEIIYPGINSEEYIKEYTEKDTKYIVKKYSLPEEYILYLGTLEPRKNIGNIIDAYAKLNTAIPLVIAGKKGWLYDEIFRKIEEYKIEDNIIFTGYVEESHKPFIYQRSKLFVFPSLYEGFGMPVLEAMAAGVPVITSNTSALPEVVGNAGILVNPLDIKQLLDSMEKVLNDDVLRNQMIKDGLDRSKMFSWESSGKKLLELYRKI